MMFPLPAWLTIPVFPFAAQFGSAIFQYVK